MGKYACYCAQHSAVMQVFEAKSCHGLRISAVLVHGTSTHYAINQYSITISIAIEHKETQIEF